MTKTLLLASVLAVSLTACNKHDSNAPAGSSSSTPSTTAPSTPAPSTTAPSPTPPAGGATTTPGMPAAAAARAAAPLSKHRGTSPGQAGPPMEQVPAPRNRPTKKERIARSFAVRAARPRLVRAAGPRVDQRRAAIAACLPSAGWPSGRRPAIRPLDEPPHRFFITGPRTSCPPARSAAAAPSGCCRPCHWHPAR